MTIFAVSVLNCTVYKPDSNLTIVNVMIRKFFKDFDIMFSYMVIVEVGTSSQPLSNISDFNVSRQKIELMPVVSL